MGPKDSAKCLHCGPQPSHWAAGDGPAQEHCGPRSLGSPVLGLDTCRAWDHVDGQILGQLRPLAEEEEEEGAGATLSRGPAFPGMGSEELRLASFYDWPLTTEVPPELLAAAGFFHTGQQDKVRCFFCYGGLQSWKRGDDPWTEHAKWFPRYRPPPGGPGSDHGSGEGPQRLCRPNTRPALPPWPHRALGRPLCGWCFWPAGTHFSCEGPFSEGLLGAEMPVPWDYPETPWRRPQSSPPRPCPRALQGGGRRGPNPDPRGSKGLKQTVGALNPNLHLWGICSCQFLLRSKGRDFVHSVQETHSLLLGSWDPWEEPEDAAPAAPSVPASGDPELPTHRREVQSESAQEPGAGPGPPGVGAGAGEGRVTPTFHGP
ncbi:baculoviral IAP repeat-containing protein 7 isoform X4 [Pongo abelii]|nr:baculoviral IAP repeat-containing protein 7 isoform X4 [Pongo abelii]